MRPIDADELEEKMYILTHQELIYAIDDARTIEAIPVEQVARMMLRITNKMPCDIVDVMCTKEDGTCGEVACWIHAIKEGWLEE